MSPANVLWILWFLLPGLDDGACRYVLPAEAATEISAAMDRARVEHPGATVQHIKIQQQRILLHLTVDGVRTLVALGRPGEEDRRMEWEHVAPVPSPEGTVPRGDGPLPRLLRSFDRAFQEDPWRCTRDAAEDFDRPHPSPAPAGGSPSLVLLLIGYGAHWLLLLAALLAWCRSTQVDTTRSSS